MHNIDRYLEIVPSKRQLMIQKMGFYAFIHFGMNTFTGKEWGDGKTPPSMFNPTALDTDQWAEVIANAGMKGIILTAKHHDGFCLYPSKFTEYSIKNSPYKNGNGDIVKELSDSCKKFGIKFGVYLSPWDRHESSYGTDGYNDFYINQLTELLTEYGEIFCIWMDGACGAAADGKEKQVYDFDRYYQLIRDLQPDCLISNCGPDIRWVGNERGLARQSEWNVVPKFSADLQTIEKNSQQHDDPTFRKRGADIVFNDLGSREFLASFDEFMWYPAEVDVSIRPGWFYHKTEDRLVRSADNLLNIYLNSVGGNSLLLLNIPPDKRGLIAESDIRNLQEFRVRLDAFFAKPIKIVDAIVGTKDVMGMVTGDIYQEIPSGTEIIYKFDSMVYCDKAVIREDTRFSQRVEKFEIYAIKNGKRTRVYNGTVIGFNKIATFSSTQCDGLALKITMSRGNPHLEHFSAYQPNGKLPKKPKFQQLKLKISEWQYKMFMKMNGFS